MVRRQQRIFFEKLWVAFYSAAFIFYLYPPLEDRGRGPPVGQREHGAMTVARGKGNRKDARKPCGNGGQEDGKKQESRQDSGKGGNPGRQGQGGPGRLEQRQESGRWREAW